MMQRPPSISVIIPLAADETLWRQLLPALSDSDDIILAAATAAPTDWAIIKPTNARWLQSAQLGRAEQMNAAVVLASGDFLWFVHADSRLHQDHQQHLRQAITDAPDAIHYFNLHFYDGNWKMRLNEWGVRLRCTLFRNPFGDQALCLSRQTFNRLGGFRENAPYGEDHLLVLAARRAGVGIRRINAAIGTSARRYHDNGWWQTVFLFQRLWIRQWRQR